MHNNLSILIPDLNRAILLLAPRHEAKAAAPATQRELMDAQFCCSTLPVWDWACHATIYRDPRINHAFRAWHDACHLALPAQHSFTLQGETLACEYQVHELLTLWPRAIPLARVVRAEIIGQAEYFATNGHFPLDQARFIEKCLNP